MTVWLKYSRFYRFDRARSTYLRQCREKEKYITDDTMHIKELYEWLTAKANIPNELSQQVTDLNFVARCSYLVFLHFLILHNKKPLHGSNIKTVREKLLNSN